MYCILGQVQVLQSAAELKPRRESCEAVGADVKARHMPDLEETCMMQR